MTRNNASLMKAGALLCSALLCSGLIPIAPTTLHAQTSELGLPASGWNRSLLSRAVQDDAQQAMDSLILAQQQGRLTASTVQNAATSLKILFDNMQETGLNAAVEKQLLANPDRLLNFQWSANQFAAVQSRMAHRGVNVSIGRIQSTLDLNAAERQQFLSEVRKVGLYQTELEAVGQLNSMARQFEENGGRPSTASMRRTRNAAHLQRVMDACWKCAALASIGIAIGACAIEAICVGAIYSCLDCAFPS